MIIVRKPTPLTENVNHLVQEEVIAVPNNVWSIKF